MEAADRFVQTLNYRGLSLPIYRRDPAGSQAEIYTILAGKEIRVKLDDPDIYESQIKRAIDKWMDLLVELDKESWLEWFDNGAHRDIRLVCNGRIIKIFLVNDQNAVNLASLREHAVHALRMYRNVARQ